MDTAPAGEVCDDYTRISRDLPTASRLVGRLTRSGLRRRPGRRGAADRLVVQPRVDLVEPGEVPGVRAAGDVVRDPDPWWGRRCPGRASTAIRGGKEGNEARTEHAGELGVEMEEALSTDT